MTNLSSPKALVADIETSPITAYVWGLKDQNISLSQIVKDWEVMAWGAKWLSAPASEFIYEDTRKQSERHLLNGIWKLLDETNILITQNGKGFDSKRLNARFMYYGMTPPSPYQHIDTYLLAKNVADFTSNKLEYLTDKLCVKYKKTSHGKFPGMSLWNECLKGNIAAWDEMKAYNKFDVLSTEELYNAIKAWGPKNMPRLFLEPSRCPVCGNAAQRRGTELVRNTVVQRIRCVNPVCGKWSYMPIPKERKGDK